MGVRHACCWREPAALPPSRAAPYIAHPAVPHRTAPRAQLYWPLIWVLTVLGAASSAGSTGVQIAVEREAVKALCGDDAGALAVGVCASVRCVATCCRRACLRACVSEGL